MPDEPNHEEEEQESRSVPSGRAARIGQFGKLAGGVAGGMMAEGARRLAKGERPALRDMLLTPQNVTRVADRLSHLRGAAMKLGQMISMDAGDMLPKELTLIMARLRQNAYRMPPRQLQKILAQQWGENWRRRFAHFGAAPIAAASIGQVHRATTHAGETLAVKVQYPGVRESIDSDVDNVATLLRVSNILPRDLDIAPLLAEAKKQLHDEADYVREAHYLVQFGELMADAPGYLVPAFNEEFSTDQVLAMEFMDGKAIETLTEASQETRNSVMHSVFELVLREIFEFGIIQSDPNFANYRYRAETGELILLDFGAACPVEPSVAAAYRALITNAFRGDIEAVREEAVAAGFIGAAAAQKFTAQINMMIGALLDELNRPGKFDFGDRAFVDIFRQQGMEIAADKQSWHIPPTQMLFVQRKISGTALLAAKLGAKIDIRALIESHFGEAR